MSYEEFIRVIEVHAEIGWEEAERAARAVLETLSERISGGQARDLAERLPPEAAAYVVNLGDAVGFDRDEFIRRVAEREDVDPRTAERHVRAVFTAIWRAVGRREMADVASELSRDYAPLLPVGPDVDVVSYDTFLERVADRAGVDGESARRAAEAVLETLAERIAGGEVQDLMVRLPDELHPPLERGDAESGGKATRMSLEEFVDRVAEREGADHDRAHDHTRAVFLTLKEALPDKDFRDIDAQLPAEYDVLIA
jgi:uncharacterized protein (DUF2267 family)